MFFSPAVISVSVVCVVSLCDSYRACFYWVQIWKLTNLNLDLQLTARVWSSVIGWLSVRCILGGVVEFFSIRLLVASTFYQRIQCFLFIFCSDDSAAELSHHHHLSEPELDFLMNLMEWNGLECCLVGGTGCLWRCVPWWLGWYLCVPAEKLQDWRDSQIHGCYLFGVLSAVARVHSAAPPPAAHRGLMTYETTRHQPGKNKLKIYRRHRHIGSVSQTISFICIEGFPLSFHLAWEGVANEIQLDDRLVDWNSSLWNVCYIFDKFVCEAQHGWNCISQLTWSFFNQISVFNVL